MGDLNYYSLSHRSRQYLSKIGLVELITDKHGYKGPGSTRSNKNNNAFDGIWGYQGLSIISYGYLPVNYGLIADRRMIWAQISQGNALGDKTLPSNTPSACKLCLPHPAGRHKYI